jgi:hypothetical protein
MMSTAEEVKTEIFGDHPSAGHHAKRLPRRAIYCAS